MEYALLLLLLAFVTAHLKKFVIKCDYDSHAFYMVGILLLLSYNAVCLFLTSESKQPVSSNFDEFVRA